MSPELGLTQGVAQVLLGPEQPVTVARLSDSRKVAVMVFRYPPRICSVPFQFTGGA